MKRYFSATIIIAWGLCACAKVQYTNRRQFNLVSADQEKQLGEQAYADVLKQTPLSKNQRWQNSVREVGRRIQAAANQPDYQWEFNVLASSQVNAFCLPGGKVAFWEGIMPVTVDDTGIAVVMGHEVAHALAHHGAERMSKSQGVAILGQLLEVGLGKADPAVRDGILQAYGIGANYGAILPWGREQESEADHIGLILMAKAGYDPNQAVAFWERMSKLGGNGKAPPEFLSTHPSDERRIAQIKAWLPEALSYYKQSLQR
jgi:predicted Zn-dependent protease